MSRSWGVALAAAGLYLLAGWALDGSTGLVRTVVTNTPDRDVLDIRRVQTIDLDGIDASAGGAAGVTAIWRGAWEVPTAGLYDLVLDGTGRSSWTIDGSLANGVAAGGAGAASRTVSLTAGFHPIEIRCEAYAPAPRLVVTVARTGQPPVPLTPATLKPRLPRNPWLRAVARALHGLLGWAALGFSVWVIRKSIPAMRERWQLPHLPAWAGRAVAWTALACVLVHGALLRIDAITGRYGPVTSPQWLAAVQMRSIAPPDAIRPASFSWQPEPVFPHSDGVPSHYRSDPYTYLDAARHMSSFYGAHFREPVFPFATRFFLRALDGQDVAVSFASAFFSVLTIWLTYLLGAAIWSRPIGLLAALGLSLDYDVISLASLGWRDDAYMAAVTLCACVMLRWWRTEQAGARVYRWRHLQIDAAHVQAAVVGVAGGFAILTRIMAVPFLVAGVLYVVVARRAAWRRQLAAAGIVFVTAGLVAAPYFVNCWRVYGDPLYTFNVHGPIYSAAEGETAWTGSTAGYVRQKIARRPFEVLDTVAQGLTIYPFKNKWHGLNAWIAGLGRWAAILSMAGLAVLATSATGRLLLLVMLASLVPFSFTWTVDPDFRFTAHVYPILLVAAAVATGAAARGIRALLVRGPRLAITPRPRRWLVWTGAVAVAFAALWFLERVSPSLVFAEALRAREDATVTAGVRDGAFFKRGWSEVMRGENVSMRVTSDGGALSIRLPDEGDYPTTLRMDPFPRPLEETPQGLPTVDVELNGVPVANIQLQWTPGRVGAYDIVLPRAAVRRGANRLVLRVNQPGAVSLWYVRVRPRE